MKEISLEKPKINIYADPVDFLKAMIDYRKRTEPAFSVMSATKSLRKVSSALVSLILQRKRKMSLDRIEEFAKLMNLNTAEKYILKIG